MSPSSPVVFMYHAITALAEDVPPGREPGAELYDVAIEDFHRHLSRAREVVDASTGEADGRAVQKVVFTFDDGEANNFTRAFPLLKQFGFSAFFFVIAERVGTPGYMGFRELERLCQAGMTVGSHGLSHRLLPPLDDAELRRELVGSKQILEDGLQRPVFTFSVPRGFHDDRVLRLAQESGYQQVFISGRPRAGEIGSVGRVPVKGDWTLDAFDRALRGKRTWRERLLALGTDSAKRVLGPHYYDRLRGGAIRLRGSSGR